MLPYMLFLGADGTKEFIVPQDTTIERVDLNIGHTIVDSGQINAQLSFLPAILVGADVDNQVSVIFHMTARIELTTSGAAVGHLQNTYDALGVPVESGERLYLHLTLAAVTADVYATIWLASAGAVRPSQRRRTR